jgi:PBP1b-binding outer membrane lipoprotein LpoB
MKRIILSAVVAASFLVGCKKDAAPVAEAPKAEAAKPAAAAPAEAAKPAAAATAWVALEKLNAKIEMPAGAKAEDTSADAANYSVAPEDFSYTVMVSTVTEAYPSTYEAAVDEVKKMTNGFKSFTKNEKTADGWVFEFEGESMMDKSPIYGATVRKKVGDKELECTRNESSKAARDAVMKACLSLAAK